MTERLPPPRPAKITREEARDEKQAAITTQMCRSATERAQEQASRRETITDSRNSKKLVSGENMRVSG